MTRDVAELAWGTGVEGRAWLREAKVSVLRRGGFAKADILVVRHGDETFVVKDFAPRSVLVRGFLGPWSLDREERAYRALAGCSFVPRLVARLDPQALVLAYRPGRWLSRSLRGRLPDGFMDALGTAVSSMHDRGVVHLDLRHRSNVLAGEDGAPVILDFASALFLVGERGPRRWLRALLQAIDRRALRKWQQRIGPLS